MAAISSIVAGAAIAGTQTGLAATAAEKQKKAAKKAQSEQERILAQERGRQQGLTNRQIEQIEQGITGADLALRDGAAGAQGFFEGALDSANQAAEAQQLALDQGFAQGRLDLQSGFNNAEQAINQSFAQGAQNLQGGLQDARRDLLGGVAGARQDLSSALGLQALAGQAAQAQTATDTLGGSRVQALMNDPNSFQQDPGFQFRLQQGERAIDRAASARGGRASGRTLQALSEFNQGLASQEFNAAFQRASAADAQVQAQAARQDAFNQQAQQNQLILAQQGFGAAGQLAQAQLGAGSQLAQAGLGTASQLAGLSQAQGGALAGLNTGLSQGLAGLSVGGAQAQQGVLANQANQQISLQGLMAQNASGLGAQRANLQQAGAQAQVQALQNQQQASLGLSGQGLQVAFQPVQFAGQTEAAIANQFSSLLELGAGVAGQGAGAAATAMSDERVKENVKPADNRIANFLDSLSPYSFDYIDGETGHFGIMAQDAEASEVGSAMVTEQDGIKMIDMKRALMTMMATVAHLNRRIKELETK